MLIKERDDNSKAIILLKKLLKLPSLTEEHDFLIRRELRNVQQGKKGEENSAYHLDFYFGDSSKNWALIHDLRLEVHGRVAQIDHLLINRGLQFYVLESKNFYNGVEINEKGEFSAFYSRKNYGIPSPIAQNERHISVLKDLFKATDILPTRLGFEMKPHYFNYVLMSPNSIIKRPLKKQFNSDNVIKADALKKIIIDDDVKGLAPKLSDFTYVAKLVSADTLEKLARVIAALHTPKQINYIKKFGIKKSETQPKEEVKPHSTPTTNNKAPKYYCFKCRKGISVEEASYCWQPQNKAKFNNKAYCRACQKTV